MFRVIFSLLREGVIEYPLITIAVIITMSALIHFFIKWIFDSAEDD